MTNIERYELRPVGDHFTLIVYIDPSLQEFATELGRKPKRKEQLLDQIQTVVNGRFKSLKITSVKIMVGTMLISTLTLEASPTQASTPASESKEEYNITYDELKGYTVKSGDTLFLIAKQFNIDVEVLRQLNKLTSNTIFVGQTLKLPFFEYTVVPGDSLSVIAKRFNTETSTIRDFNNLQSDLLLVNQSLKIPITLDKVQNEKEVNADSLTNNTTIYTVVSGDSLSVIAKRFNTTVTRLKEVNNLTSDVLFIGQKLVIPGTSPVIQEPNEVPPVVEEKPRGITEENNILYTVISGDSLSVIAKKFNTTVTAIKEQNQLTTDVIRVGQQLTIPLAINIEEPQQSVPIKEEKVEETTVLYTVVSGDSLSVIARKYSTTVNAIKERNNLTNDIIHVGQQLVIPTTNLDTTSPIEEESKPILEETNTNYTVVPGDSLSVIAKRFNTTVNAIKDANQLQSDMIRVGQTLIIPIHMTVEEEVKAPNAPQFTYLDPINGLSVDAYTVTGKSDPGTEIQLTFIDENGRQVSHQMLSNEDGLFNGKINLEPLADGDISLSSFAITNRGVKSETRTTVITKDTFASTPTVQAIPYANNGNQHNFTINGQGEAGSVIYITVTDDNGMKINTETEVKANGEFVTTLDLKELNDSKLLIHVKQRDTVGNLSDSTILEVEKDTVPPFKPTLLTHNYINNQNENAYTLHGKAESNAEINITVTGLDGQQIEASGKGKENGEFNIIIDTTPFEDGPLILEISSNDRAGNFSESSSYELIKNTIKPVIEMSSTPAIFSDNEREYELSGRTTPNANVKLTLSDGKTTIADEGTADSEGNVIFRVDLRSLNDGDISASIQTTDPIGNIGEKKQLFIVKDTIPPQELILTALPFVNQTNQNNYLVNGSSEEEGGNVFIRATNGDQTFEEVAKISNGEFVFRLDFSGFTDGPIDIELTQTDSFGNSGNPETVTIKKVTQYSEPTIVRSGYVMEGSRLLYSMTGTAEPLSSITITIDDNSGKEPLIVTHQVNESGIFNIDMDVSGLQHINGLNISVIQTDRADNKSEIVSSEAITYKVVAGDSLSMIAKRFNTTVEGIRQVNNLKSDTIFVDQILRLPILASESVNLGYVYFGDPKGFTNQVLRTNRSMNTVSPSYFDINPDGTLKLTYQVDPTFISNMQNQGIRVVPFLSNHWDREIGRSMLANREQAAEQIRDAVMRYNLNGINIDIENITHTDRANFTEFVRLVREKLPSSKEVSVAVAANPNGWTTGWHGAYDYASLAKHADYLMIMTYDESYQGSDPGPVASYSFVERSIQYAINQGVPRDKIVIGLAHYGRYWIEGQSQGGNALSNSQINQMINTYDSTVTFDEKTQSAKAIVTIKETDPKTYVLGRALPAGTYTIWFENDESYKAKASLVQKHGIKGLGHWSIGQENTNVWNSYPLWTAASSQQRDNVGDTMPEQPIYQTYTVVSGDSLYKISQQFNTTVNAIKELNGLNSDMIFVGQVIKIP
ncbi:LysM peptidoglycan-binding domain-containing protein [Sutcliffiella cohnii]|uniref:LysM peptidoglycan-binding domain-containing protein n=1 Tax=Sutcliffiella cohnii TaxID=33932 RepID=UPI002E1F5E51|nr:LysM peptidoglycan-binding domain-containing protein [Sutcliffiella cohnii]